MLTLTIAGRIGKVNDELKWTASSTAILSFGICTDVGFGDKKHPVWVQASIFGKRAEALHQYIKQGGNVTATGNADLRSWESNGKAGTSLELNVSEITLQGGGGNGSQSDSPEQANTGFRDKPAQFEGGFEESDIPFN